jgi:hypothetical protein
VYTNCNSLGPDDGIDGKCIVPFPFFGSGRSLTSVEDLQLAENEMRTLPLQEQIAFHRSMIQALEGFLAAH